MSSLRPLARGLPFLLTLASCFAAPQKPAKLKPLKAADVFKRVGPTVVAIDCMNANNVRISTAAGFIVSADGKIVTNLHVIALCQRVATRLANGDIYDSASVVEYDMRKDLAVIRIKAASLPVATLADSNDLEVGQNVYSIGNPNGLQNTLQQGLVSGFRQMDGYKLVQVSASLNPGNSGGPIVDEAARIVAVAASKIQGMENLGFAIPINYAKGYLDSKNETPFATFAATMHDTLTKVFSAMDAAKPAPGGIVGGVPGGVPSGASGGVPGGIMGGVPSGAGAGIGSGSGGAGLGKALPPARFSTIETLAGGDWRFQADGLPAMKVPLGHSHGVTTDPEGNIYATNLGNQAIVKIDTQGALHVLAGPDSPSDRQPANPTAIAMDTSGNIYFTENRGRIRKLTPTGNILAIAGTNRQGFTPDALPAVTASIGFSTGIAVAPDGTIVFSDGSNHRVRRIDAQGALQTIAGDGQKRFAGDGGPASQASLADPAGLAFDAAGNLFIADRNNSRVRRVSADGTITTVAGRGVTQDDLGCPIGVALNSKGALFVADPCKRRVFRIQNGQSSIVGGTGPRPVEPAGENGPATSASFDEWGIALDGKDNVLITSPDYGYLYRIDRNGRFDVVAGLGNWRAPVDGTAGKDARFQRFGRAAFDKTGAVFVSDFDANRIYRLNEAGAVFRLAGNSRGDFNGENSPAMESGVNRPVGIRVRPDGTVVYVESGGQRVREVTPDGKLGTIAGNGRSTYAGDAGRAIDGSLASPQGICFDNAGNI